MYYPADGAAGVPTDVVPRAFVAAAGSDPPVGVGVSGPTGAVPGAFSVVDNEVRFTPASALSPASNVE